MLASPSIVHNVNDMFELTGPGICAASKEATRVTAYSNAMHALNDAGILVLAAAGNEQTDNDALKQAGYANLPCSVPLENIIAVGATDQELCRWSQGSANPVAMVKGSNYGKTTVDVGAPGSRIVGAQTTSKGSTGGIETRCELAGVVQVLLLFLLPPALLFQYVC